MAELASTLNIHVQAQMCVVEQQLYHTQLAGSCSFPECVSARGIRMEGPLAVCVLYVVKATLGIVKKIIHVVGIVPWVAERTGVRRPY